MSQLTDNKGATARRAKTRPLPPLSKLYKVDRDQVEREDELIYHRTYWLLTTQSILFAAYTVAIVSMYSGLTSKPLYDFFDIQPWDTARHDTIRFLLWFTPALGLLVALVNFMATLAALEAIAALREHYDQNRIYMAEDIPLPSLISVSWTHFYGTVPARTLAPLFSFCGRR